MDLPCASALPNSSIGSTQGEAEQISMPVNAVKPGSERANDSCNDIPPQPTNCANKRYRQVYVTVPSSRTNPRGRVWRGLSLQIVATAAEQINAQTLHSLVCVCVRVCVQIHILGQSYNNVHHSKGQKVKRRRLRP